MLKRICLATGLLFMALHIVKAQDLDKILVDKLYITTFDKVIDDIIHITSKYQEPPTNIVNGLGIFTGVNTDTLYLNVIQQK